MPPLENPRHERYAQLIVEGLANGDSKPYSQSRAYIAAGYTARDNGRSSRCAQAASSRLLSRVIHRVRELQAIAARNAAETAEKMTRELNEVLHEARRDKAHGAAVSAILGKAKILNIGEQPQHLTTDFSQAQSMHDIGRKLLESVGLSAPDDVSIEAAIEANDTFIARLEAIRDSAQGLTLDQDEE